MSTIGWIWPKDPRPGNPSHWPRRWRFFDVFTNKGPDIFVGKINTRSNMNKTKNTKNNKDQNACHWSRWERPNNNIKNNKRDDSFPLFRSGHDPAAKYDFRTRKYRIPDIGTWSRVEYCDGPCTTGVASAERRRQRESQRGKISNKNNNNSNKKCEKHIIPLRFWDKNGKVYPAYCWHDAIYGKHADADRGDSDHGHGHKRIGTGRGTRTASAWSSDNKEDDDDDKSTNTYIYREPKMTQSSNPPIPNRQKDG